MITRGVPCVQAAVVRGTGSAMARAPMSYKLSSTSLHCHFGRGFRAATCWGHVKTHYDAMMHHTDAPLLLPRVMCALLRCSTEGSVVKVQGYMMKRGHFRLNWLLRCVPPPFAGSAPDRVATPLHHALTRSRRIVLCISWFELKVTPTAPRTQLCYYDKRVRASDVFLRA